MPVSNEYRLAVESRLSKFAPVTSRRLFGGLAFYSQDLIFALADDDRLYFKTSTLNRGDYERLGSTPFIPIEGGKPSSYWEVPVNIYSDDAALPSWISRALAVSAEAKKPRASRSKRPPA
jgi:DNA transformation protein